MSFSGYNFGAVPGLMGLNIKGKGMGNVLFGEKEKMTQAPIRNQQGSEFMDWLMSQGKENMDFGKIRDNEINRFNTQTIPGLAERFSGMGGGQRSSGFQGALGNAATGLSENLAAQQSQFGMHQGMMGLQPQFENIFRPRQRGLAEEGLMGLMKFLPFLAMM